MRIRIGVDLDDTLCDFTGPCNDWYNKKYGTTHRLSDYTGPYAEVWLSQELTNDAIKEFIREHLSAEASAELPPLPGAQAFFQGTDKSIYEFFLISARNSCIQAETEQWIERYFPGVFTRVILCDYYSDQPKRCKTDVCKELGVRIMIDEPSFRRKTAVGGIQDPIDDTPDNI